MQNTHPQSNNTNIFSKHSWRNYNQLIVNIFLRKKKGNEKKNDHQWCSVTRFFQQFSIRKSPTSLQLDWLTKDWHWSWGVLSEWGVLSAESGLSILTAYFYRKNFFLRKPPSWRLRTDTYIWHFQFLWTRKEKHNNNLGSKYERGYLPL